MLAVGLADAACPSYPVFDQAIDYFGIVSRCLRVHADVGEARNGVHLVDDECHIRRQVDTRMLSQPRALNARAAMSRVRASTCGGGAVGTLSAAPSSSRYFA